MDDVERGYELVVPDEPNGPVVTYLLRRTGVALAGLAAVSLAVMARSKQPGTKAAALGALAPGAGYAYSGHSGRMAATAGAFGLSLATWWGTGNVLLPPAIWAGTALDARRLARSGHPREAATKVVPLALAAGAAAGMVASRRGFRAAQERGRERARYLRTEPRVTIPASSGPVEMDAEDLAAQRAFLDRALQPVDEFAGFDMVEQFQTAAVRYQIFMADYVLAFSQLTRTPAFRGYLSAAQRSLIDKTTQKKVWGYWRWEQTWGNLSFDWDPMARDNIMLSGYLGQMLGFYESNTGDQRYRQPGSLPFRLRRRSWDYDFGKVADAVHDNMVRSRMTLFPCEPNWVYNMCNMTGINTLLLSDRLRGTEHEASVGDDFRRRLREEFVTPDGRITAIRSARLGLTIPMLTSTLADCAATTMLHPSDPELAHRTWAIVRNEFVDVTGPQPTITLRGWDAIDTGNYQLGEIGAFATVMWAAAEMGDTGLYDTLKASADERFEPEESNGTRWYRNGSTQANAIFGMGRFATPGAFRRMVTDGPGRAVLDGPYLEGADYPEVLVAHADTDGQDLRLVLRPGLSDVPRQRLGIEQLRPGARYTVSGAVTDEVVADGSGHATLEVDLAGRVEVALSPAS